MRNGKKYCDDLNAAKLQGIVRNQGAFKNGFPYKPDTWVPVWEYLVPRLLVQYKPQRNLAIFMCLLQR